MQTAVDEAARVTIPGGKVAATVWSPLGSNPYFATQIDTLRGILGSDTTESFAGAFSCPARTVSSVFKSSGLTDVRTSEVAATIELPATVEYLSGHLSAIPWGITVAETPGVDLRSVAEDILAALEPCTHTDRTAAPFSSMLVVGIR